MREITIRGRLGRDVSVQFGQKTGKAYAQLSIAVSRKVHEAFETDWYVALVYEDLAEACATLRKGDKVIVCGKLAHSKWTDKNNVERLTMQIAAEDVAIPVQSLYNKTSNFDSFGGGVPVDHAAPNPNDEEIPF